MTHYQRLFINELHNYGGVCLGLWAAAGHRARLVDEEIYEQALARICNTDRFNPGNVITAELLASGPRSEN